MYKVFVNDKPIILTDSLKKENNFPIYIFKNMIVDEIIYRLHNENTAGIYLYCNDLKNDWNEFLTNFHVIPAAGGMVINKKQEILFIYRANKWDLPKGHIEKGEHIEATAIREVEEECGITNLVIDRFLLTTYHIFFQNNRKNIKETHWFLMFSDFEGKLTPQLEEGITEVTFKSESEVEKALENAYSNILLVYETYLTKR